MTADTKRCSKCGEWKPRAAFSKKYNQVDGLQRHCRACCALYAKMYRQKQGDVLRDKNRQYNAARIDQHRAYNAKRYREHAEELKAYQARYRKEHAEQLKARKQGYRTRNKAKVAAGLRRWYIDHAIQRRRYTRDWQRANPIKVARLSRRRRALKIGATGSHTTQEWIDLCARYGNKCLACGKITKLTADHIVPLVRGGSDDIANIQPLCLHCNTRKATKTIDYRPGYEL